MVNATRRAKARLDSPGIALQGRVQADTLGAQQREIRAAVSGLPQPERRQARSEADGPTCNGALSAHGARGTDVHGASANHDRRNGAPVESRTGIRRRVPARGRHRRDACVRSQVRPRGAVVGRFVNAKTSLRITRCVGLASSRVERVGRSVESQRPDRIGREAARDECPVWRVCERLVCAPDTAAGGCNPKRAVVVCASRRDRQRSNATGGCVVTPAESQNIRNIRYARAYEGPDARRGWPLTLRLPTLSARPPLA